MWRFAWWEATTSSIRDQSSKTKRQLVIAHFLLRFPPGVAVLAEEELEAVGRNVEDREQAADRVADAVGREVALDEQPVADV